MTEPIPCNPSDVMSRLDADEVSTCADNSSGQARNIDVINESGPDFTHLIPRRRVSRFTLR